MPCAVLPRSAAGGGCLICTDDGRSGATLARPGLDRLRDLIAEGTYAAVLVCSPDRLARNPAYQVLVPGAGDRRVQARRL